MSLDGQRTEKIGAFRNRVAATPPDSSVDLRVFRDGTYLELSATTREMEEAEAAPEDGTLQLLP